MSAVAGSHGGKLLGFVLVSGQSLNTLVLSHPCVSEVSESELGSLFAEA